MAAYVDRGRLVMRRTLNITVLVLIGMSLSSCGLLDSIGSILTGTVNKAYRLSMPDSEVKKDKELGATMQEFMNQGANINLNAI